MTRMKSLISKKLVSIFIAIMLSFLILCNSFIAPERAKVGIISVSFVVGSRWLYSWKNEYQGNVALEELCILFHVRAKIDPWPCLRMLKFPYVSGRFNIQKKKKRKKYHIVEVFSKNIVSFEQFYTYKQSSIGFDSVKQNQRFLIYLFRKTFYRIRKIYGNLDL